MCAALAAYDAALAPDNIAVEGRRRWLKNAEIVEVLSDPKRFGLTASSAPPSVPQSGDMFIFDKRLVRSWRRDGHLWKKKKDGKNVMEHHEKLKVRGVDMINCCYAHHDTIDGFHRRCYWLLTSPHIVLVHYRHQKRPRLRAVSFDDSIFLGSESATLGQSPPALHPFSPACGLPPVPLFDDPLDERPQPLSTSKGAYAKSCHHPRPIRQSPYSPASTAYSPVSAGYSPVLSTSSDGSDARCGASSRKERKAHFAKISRERKKAHVHELELKVRRLSIEIDHLESRIPAASKRRGEKACCFSPFAQQKQAIDAIMPQCIENLRRVLPHNDNSVCTLDVETELKSLLSSMSMRSSLATELVKLARCSCSPCSQAKFALWGLDQVKTMASDTVSSPAEVRGIWQSLLQGELGLSDEQWEELQRCRNSARELREQQTILEDEFDEIVQDMSVYSDHLDTVLSNFLRVLEPAQMARYFCWVDQRTRQRPNGAEK